MVQKSKKSDAPFDFKRLKNSTHILEFTLGSHSAHLFEIKKPIISTKTSFQTVDIVELFQYGKTLFLDKRLQASEVDEFIYHETIVHPALLTHPNPKKVLVIGGSDGGAINQVLKHKSVKEVILADLDGELVGLCQKYLPSISNGAYSDPRVKTFFGDGRKFLEDYPGKFDVIISDLVAPLVDPPSYLLFTEEFFKIVSDKLNPEGVFSLQADGASSIDCNNFAVIYNTVKKVFPICRPLQAYIPCYDCPWGFIVASKKSDPLKINSSQVEKRLEARGIKGLKFYDERIHQSLFTLPKNLLLEMAKQKKIITDKNPLVG
jgi:spermidine synthase